MSIEIKIREATINDCEVLSKVISTVVLAIPYYNDLAKKTEISKFQPSDLESKLKDDPNSVIIATFNNEIVGFCLTRFDDYLIWLEWFGVLEKYRGYNIANMLLTDLDDRIINRNCHKIWCDCRTSNVASIHILSNHGFSQIATIPNHWYKQDFILWQKEIKN